MNRLIIAEKPSVGRDIAAFLGNQSKKNGYIEAENGKTIVTWCFGHITSLADTDAYLPAPIIEPGKKKTTKRAWLKEDLPILPNPFKIVVTEPKQFKIIKELLTQAKKDKADIYNAGDPDREGQLLVDRVLEQCKINPDDENIKRILPSALDEASLKKMLKDVRQNSDFANLRNSAKARAAADWVVGMNATRALTIANRTLINVGRVMLPTATLVVERDKEIANFKSKDYFVPQITMPDDVVLTWKKHEEPTPKIDSENRIIDENFAKSILESCKNGSWEVIESGEKDVVSAPPLPYHLASLQQFMASAYKVSAQKTLDAAQSLYQDHKLTTYPRTDCRYLPEEQFSEVEDKLKALNKNFKEFMPLIDKNRKSKAFNSKKVTAHHAIIPTVINADLSKLNDIEKKVYNAVCLQYLAQFAEDSISLKKKLVLKFNEMDTFSSEESIIKKAGWKAILKNIDDEDEKEKK